MGSFTIEGKDTMIPLYCNSSIAISEPFDNNVVEIDFQEELKNYRLKKTKNGVCFFTGGDQYIASHLYVNKTGKVLKIIIDFTMDFREAFDNFGSIDLLYIDQFNKKLSKRKQDILQQNKTSVKYRKHIANVKITSNFINIGLDPKYLTNKKKLPKSSIVKVERTNQVLKNLVLPVKNKIYPIYINSYFAPDDLGNGKVSDKIFEQKIIVIENIEGCYMQKITNKNIRFFNFDALEPK